jgi:predicted  nucleic acid-binding Zn-ribbon protein
MQALRISLTAVVLLTATGLAFGQKGDVAALKKQRDSIAQQLSAKDKELRAIREAIAKSDKVAPVQKEMLTAYEAVQARKQADPEVQKARKTRDEANNAREATITAELKASKDGARLQKQIDDANARIKQAQETIHAAERSMVDLRGKIAKDSSKVAAATVAADKAGRNYEEIKASKTSNERAKHDKIRATFDAKTNELLAADTRAVGLQKSIDDLQKKDRELASQIRAIENPAKGPAKAKTESKGAEQKTKDKAKQPDKSDAKSTK